MKSTVVGLGYIGLPTAAILTSSGIFVKGIDCRSEVVDSVNSGSAHITEPGLGERVESAVTSGLLQASHKPEIAEVHIIAVPTPVSLNYSADLSHLTNAVRDISGVLRPDDLLIIESTIPPSTCNNLVGPLIVDLTGMDHMKDYYLVHCPERVIPGRIIHEIIHNDRIIGGTRPQATQKAAELYSRFCKGKLLLTDATTAEMCKLAENTYRDVNIALANEFARISDRLGIDVHEMIALANHHPRVNILQPGIGVGGHCIAVDPWFLVHAAPEQAKLIHTARQVNDSRPDDIVEMICNATQDAGDAPIALLGLAYKPDVDDLRESPAVHIVQKLAAKMTNPLRVVEPHTQELPKPLRECPSVRLAALDEALQTCPTIVLLVPHQAFRELDRAMLVGKTVVDPLAVWK